LVSAVTAASRSCSTPSPQLNQKPNRVHPHASDAAHALAKVFAAQGNDSAVGYVMSMDASVALYLLALDDQLDPSIYTAAVQDYVDWQASFGVVRPLDARDCLLLHSDANALLFFLIASAV